MKNVAVLLEDRAFALFFRLHPGEFDSSRVPTPGNLPFKAKKNANAWGVSLGRGVGARHSWNWLMLEYTNSKIKNLFCHLALANKQQEDIM